MLFLTQTQSIRYHYDFNGNRTTTVLPDGRQINYLYYGSGHLHQINLDGEVISDIERDKLHREIQRTQGALTSRYELDPLGRLKKQIAALNGLSESGKGKNKVAAGYGQTAVKRSYGYDKTGNLLHSSDQRTGTTHFEYDKLGRITQAGDERFAFDPAHNILSTNGQTVSDGLNAVTDNRIKHYNGISYYYDDLGNLIHRELPDGEVQNYFYDLHDQLVKVEIQRKDADGDWYKETWVYTYDALGRRISKGRLKTENAKDILDSKIAFLWDGSHLLQETHSDGLYTYIYTDQDSYEPLAQIRDWRNEEKTEQSIHYFHCDQIGIPREMTDKGGNLLWFGDYYGWGKLKSETNINNAHQPFRLQNQYYDEETGLHYNLFRYYEPDVGRFVNQDPIKLQGGTNLYNYGFNSARWVDSLGLLTQAELIDIGKEKIESLLQEERAKSNSKRASTVNVIVTSDGQVFEGCSSKSNKGRNPRPLDSAHHDVQEAYGKAIPPLGAGHGYCGEVTSLTKALDAVGREGLKGAISMAHTTNKTSGQYISGCQSCTQVLSEMGIEDVVASGKV